MGGTPPAVEIRPARPADARAVASVARRTWHAAYDDVIGPDVVETVVDRWYDPERLRVEIHDATCFPVAETDAEGLVGYAHGGRRNGGDAVAELFRLYVHPDRWNEGIGSALLATVHDALCGPSVERLRLAVLAENEVGRRFYARRGYEPVDRTTATLGGEEYDELVLATDC